MTLSAANSVNATLGGVDINANIKSNGGNIMVGSNAGTQVNGFGYALNSSSGTAAVVVERGVNILSGGGNIVINGKSLVGSNNGSYSGVTGGVFIMSNANINSGTGNLFITGVSTAGNKTFGVAFEGNSNTLTTVGNSAGGGMLLNAVNTTAGNTQAVLDQGAIGLVSYGNRARVAFQGNSVASWLVLVNGVPQLSAYTQSPQLSSCASPYPNCGTLVIPGSNNSYLYATYQAVSMSTQPIYVIQNAAGTKTYDGNNTATGLSFTTMGGSTASPTSSRASRRIIAMSSTSAAICGRMPMRSASASKAIRTLLSEVGRITGCPVSSSAMVPPPATRCGVPTRLTGCSASRWATKGDAASPAGARFISTTSRFSASSASSSSA